MLKVIILFKKLRWSRTIGKGTQFALPLPIGRIIRDHQRFAALRKICTPALPWGD
jgi:hypothetical protein